MPCHFEALEPMKWFLDLVDFWRVPHIFFLYQHIVELIAGVCAWRLGRLPRREILKWNPWYNGVRSFCYYVNQPLFFGLTIHKGGVFLWAAYSNGGRVVKKGLLWFFRVTFCWGIHNGAYVNVCGQLLTLFSRYFWLVRYVIYSNMKLTHKMANISLFLSLQFLTLNSTRLLLV